MELREGVYGRVVIDPRLGEFADGRVVFCSEEDLYHHITEIVLPKNCKIDPSFVAQLSYEYHIKVVGDPENPQLPYKDGVFYSPDFRVARVISPGPGDTMRLDERCTSIQLVWPTYIKPTNSSWKSWEEYHPDYYEGLFIRNMADCWECGELPFQATLAMGTQQFIDICRSAARTRPEGEGERTVDLWDFLSFQQNIQIALDQPESQDGTPCQWEKDGVKYTVRLYDDVMYAHIVPLDPPAEEEWVMRLLKYNKKVYRIPTWFPFDWVDQYPGEWAVGNYYRTRFFCQLPPQPDIHLNPPAAGGLPAAVPGILPEVLPV